MGSRDRHPGNLTREVLSMTLGQHAGYILGAYAFTALVIGGLTLHALRDQRSRKRELDRLQGEVKDGPGGRA